MHLVLLVSLISLVNVCSADSIATSRAIKNKRICRSCGEVAKEVSKRLEHTELNPRVIQVAARIGADGRPIPGRKIDYLSSESRYFDIFTDICETMSHTAKSGCYLITNEYEDQLKEWFKEHRDESFLTSFCYKELPDCNKEVYEASLTDIELENYEEDKDKIDDDFMPEFKEENVKAEESNFAKEAAEKVKDLRDNLLDILDASDMKVRQFLTNNVLENQKLRAHLDQHLKPEHYELFLNNWWFAALSLIVSMVLPIVFVIFLKKYHQIEVPVVNARSSSRSKASKKSSKSTLKAPAVAIHESSESEAAEADDEKATTVTRKSGRSSKVLSSSIEPVSPIKRSSKRNSKSQAD